MLLSKIIEIEAKYEKDLEVVRVKIIKQIEKRKQMIINERHRVIVKHYQKKWKEEEKKVKIEREVNRKWYQK